MAAATSPSSGNYDGAGRTDVGIFDPTNSTFAYVATGTGAVVVEQLVYLGHGNVPLSSDYEGDGRTDFADFDPTSSTFASLPSGGGSPLVQPFGYLGHGNEPVPAAGIPRVVRPAMTLGARAGVVAVDAAMIPDVATAGPTSVPPGRIRSARVATSGQARSGSAPVRGARGYDRHHAPSRRSGMPVRRGRTNDVRWAGRP